MTQQTRVQNKFGGGELDPVLEERYDIQQYDSSISESLNVMCTNRGELISRPGTEIVKTQSSDTRIIPFVFSNDTAFRLEFTNGVLKIYQGSTQITSNVKWYFSDSTYDPSFQGEHYAGTEPKQFPFQVGDDFTIGTDVSGAGSIIYERATAGTTFTVTLDSDVFTVANNYPGRTSEAATDGTNDVPIYDIIEIYKQGETDTLLLDTSVTAPSSIYWNFNQNQWTSPYTSDELQDIQFDGVGDVMYFVHPNHQPMKLERVGDTDFTFSPHWTKNGPWKPGKSTYGESWDAAGHSGDSAYNRGCDVTYTPLTSSSGSKRVDPDKLLGRMIRLRPYSVDSAAGADERQTNGSGYIKTVNQTAGALTSMVVEIWYPFKAAQGKYTTDQYDLGGSADAKPDNLNIGYLFEEDPGDGTGGWPGSVAIWEDRLVYGGSSAHPTTIAASSKNDFDDFSPDDGGRGATSISSKATPSRDYETVATNGFVYSLQEGDSSKITWIKGTPRGLMVATENGIHISRAPDSSKSLSATNFELKLSSHDGAAPIRPVFTDGRIYYVGSKRDKLFSTTFDFQTDTYSSQEESIFVGHLLEDGITDMAFCRSPVQVIWLATTTGYLVSMVFLKEQQQVGFFNHRIAGPTEDTLERGSIFSLCTLPNNYFTPNFDQLYLSIKRPSSLSDSYIERLSPYPMGTDPNLFNTLDMAMSPFDSGTPVAVTSINRNKAGSIDRLSISVASHGLSTNDDFALAGFKGFYEYLNGGDLYNADTVFPTAIIADDERTAPNGITAVGDIYSGHGWLFESTATYAAGDGRWQTGRPFVVREKGVVLTKDTDYTHTNNLLTFVGNTGYMAFVGYAPRVYLTLLPDSRANQQGRGEAYLANISRLTFKVRNTRNFTVTREGGTSAVSLIESPQAQTAGESAILVSGKYSVEPEQIQDDLDGKFRIDVEPGYPLTLQSVYVRGERTSR